MAKKAAAVEAELNKNPQYAYAREIGQLGTLIPVVVENAMQRYIDYKHSCGSRIGDIKIPALQSDREWLRIIRELDA